MIKVFNTTSALRKNILRALVLGALTLTIIGTAIAQSSYSRKCTTIPGYTTRNSQCEAWQDFPRFSGVSHIYAYFNDTDQRLPQNKDYAWFDVIDRIVYDLNHSDTQANLQLQKSTCDLLHTHSESSKYLVVTDTCTGSNRFKVQTPWGQKYVSVDVNYNKSTQKVTWEFGQYRGQKSGNGIDYSQEKPIISGINPSEDPATATNENLRKFEFGINLLTKDVTGKNEWQATTTATAYSHSIGFHLKDKTWKRFHQNYGLVIPMGKEITHWKRTTTPPPSPTPTPTPPPTPTPNPPICASLSVIRPSTITNPAGSTTIEIQTKDQFGRTWNGNYKYSTRSGTGKFAEVSSSSSSGSVSSGLGGGSDTNGTFAGGGLSGGFVGGGFTSGGFTSFVQGANPLNTKSKTVSFSGGKYDDWILVEDVSRPSVCRAWLRVPEAPKPQCLSLSMNPSGNIATTSLPYKRTVNIGSSFSNQGTYTPKYRWAITPSSANAYIITPSGSKVKYYEGTQTSLDIEYNDPTNSATLTVAEVSDQQRCIKTLKLTPPPPKPVCTGLTLSPNGQKQLGFNDLPFIQSLSVNATYSGTVSKSEFNWTVNGDSSANLDGLSRDITGTQKSRTFNYNGKTAATVTVTEVSNPNDKNPNLCKQTFTVIPPEAGKCTGLTLSPDLGTVKSTTYPYKVKLKAAATFSNNPGQKPAYKWEVTNSNGTVNGKSTVEGVDEVEFIATGPSGVRVIELTDPGICQKAMGVINEENFCRNLKATFNGQDPFGKLPAKEFPYDVKVEVSEVNAEYPNLPFTEQLIYKTPTGDTNPTQTRSFTYRAEKPGRVEVIDESNPLDCRAYIDIPDAPKKEICESLEVKPTKMKVGETKNFEIVTSPADFDGTFTFSSPDDCTRYTDGRQGVFDTKNRSVDIEALRKCTIQITTKNKDGEEEVNCKATITMEEETPVLCTDIDVSFLENGQKVTAPLSPANFPRNFKVKVDAVYTDDDTKPYDPQFEYFFIPRGGTKIVDGPSADREKDFPANGPGTLGVRVTTPQYGEACQQTIEIPPKNDEVVCTDVTVSPTSLRVGNQTEGVLTIGPENYPGQYIFTSTDNECVEIDGQVVGGGSRVEKNSAGLQTKFQVKGNKKCSVAISTIDRNTGTVQPQCSASINFTTGGGGSNDCAYLNVQPSSFPAGTPKTINLAPSPAKAYKFKFSANQNECATIKDGSIEKKIGGSVTYTSDVASSRSVVVTGHTRDCKVTVETIDVNKGNQLAPQCKGEITFSGGGGCCGGGTPTPTPTPPGGTPTPTPTPPGGGGSKSFDDEIEKSVNRTTVDKDGERVRYTVKYTITRSDYGNDAEYKILFDDTLGRDVRPNNGGDKNVGKGKIPGSRSLVNQSTVRNWIEYGANFKAAVQLPGGGFQDIPKCADGEEKKQCYTGDISQGNIGTNAPNSSRASQILDGDGNILVFHDLKFPDPNNRILFFSYDGIIKWQDREFCNRDKVSRPPKAYEECPGDKFPNEIREINITHEDFLEDDDAVVYVICPYILTRDGGDVFFEEGPLTGIDVSCIDRRFKNSDGVVIQDRPRVNVGLIKSGRGSTTASACDNGKNGVEMNLVNHFSSFICEIQFQTRRNDDWQLTNIELAVNQNKERVSRFVKSKTDSNISSTSSKKLRTTIRPPFSTMEAIDNHFQKPNTYSNVYYFEKGNMTIHGKKAGTGNDKTTTFVVPALKEGEKTAARTIIIQEGDLIIKSNIKYEKPMSLANNRARPTIAFIVLNGNIVVDKSVTRLDGLYFVDNAHEREVITGKSKNRSTSRGHLAAIGGESSPWQLIINGAVFGDLDELGKKRTYVGPPNRDGGAIVIRYDENLLLNPPAGIEDYLKGAWQRQAR